MAAVSGCWPRNAAYWDLFVAESADRHPVLSWHGNQHYARFLFATDPPIDFVLSSAPRRAIERGAGGTPPPKDDEAKIRLLLEREKFFVDAAEARGLDLATIELTPPSVMLKLWSLAQDMMRERCDEASAIFIAVPGTLRSEEGFLPEHYWSGDVTHANAAFGRAFVEHIVAVLPDLLRSTEHAA